jgi:hypothetical protein
MQNYQDKYLKERVELIAQSQANGKLVAIETEHSDYYPLPAITELPGVRAGRFGGFELDGAPFRRFPVPTVWDIQAAKFPGVEIVPLQLASVHAHEAGLLVTTAADTQFTLDERWTAGEKIYDFLAKVNRRLAADKALGAVAWEVTWDDDYQPPHSLSLATEHVSVVCSSAVWDAENRQLVAATLVSPNTQSLRAITSTLATNSKRGLSLSVDGASYYLQNARRGYTAVSGNLSASGAEGNLLTIVHPLAGNPQDQPADHFYALTPKEQDLTVVFIERLALAIPWPTRPEWTGYLMEAGSEKELIRPLETSGPDFTSALCVQKNEAGWKAVIEAGLADGKIHIATKI